MSKVKMLIGGLVLGSLILGTVGQAQAANLVKSWSVAEAEADSQYSIYGGGHAFWLPELVSGGKFVLDGTSTFEEYDDNTAHLFGNIVAKNDSNKQFTFDLWFEKSEVGFGGLKKELKSFAYKENGGSIDTNTWLYYSFSETLKSTLTGLGEYTGETVEISDFNNGRYVVQVGQGANGKNKNMGLSTWFSYEGENLRSSPRRHADINIDLSPNSQSVPEPVSMGFISLSLLGLAVPSLKRSRI